MLDKFLFLFSAVEEKVVTYYEKKNRPSLQGCYVKRDRKVYPAGAVWHPYVQPFGYMRCHACTCMVSGGTTYKKRAHTARAFLSLGPTLFYVRVIPKKERFWRSVGIPRVFGQQYKRKCMRLFLTVPPPCCWLWKEHGPWEFSWSRTQLPPRQPRSQVAIQRLVHSGSFFTLNLFLCFWSVLCYFCFQNRLIFFLPTGENWGHILLESSVSRASLQKSSQTAHGRLLHALSW